MKVIRRVSSFVVFRLIPLLLLIAIGWFGWQVVQSFSRVFNEQTAYQQRAASYAGTATALVPAEANADFAMISYRLGQTFITNTPIPDKPVLFITNTPQPDTSQSTSGEATATLPALGTPAALPTIMFADSAADGQALNGTAVPTQVPPIERQYDLINILLLGQDNEITGESLARTDTMIVLSINRETNTVAMLPLPRDLYVYLPNGTMGRLNIAYGVGQNIGWTGGGFFFMRQTLLYNFGINTHYYAMVDLSGFSEAIDILGGVDLAVDCAIQDLRLVGAEVPKSAQRVTEDGEYLLPIGYYAMTGKEALWYARSRGNSDDFDRGRRQIQVLRAGWRKAKETGLLTKLPELWSRGTDIIETDLPFNEMVGLLPVALDLNPNSIENFRLIRTYHTTPWQTPDGDFVQIPNPDPIRELMTDFYTPPTQNQVTVDAAQIRVFNGTPNADWDRVAAERLGWDSFNAAASGVSEKTDYASTILIDYTGSSPKDSSLNEISELLKVKPENILKQPDPNRAADFDVIIGADYSSCTFNVLPPEQE